MSIPEEERESQGSNEPTREQCLLDATGCLYKLAAGKACHHWSFMLEGNRTGRSISEFKNYLTVLKPQPTRRFLVNNFYLSGWQFLVINKWVSNWSA